MPRKRRGWARAGPPTVESPCTCRLPQDTPPPDHNLVPSDLEGSDDDDDDDRAWASGPNKEKIVRARARVRALHEAQHRKK